MINFIKINLKIKVIFKNQSLSSKKCILKFYWIEKTLKNSLSKSAGIILQS